ncbi:response regulator [Duganella sp. FT92W]|uniref:Response regulator n=1 Tax=Pseudoduganella rivuli TaxID=2666085 RepID=A0A7X2IND1_9BURK|nr:response regulator [Pseudoduganella rivuli]MRV73039.1 response regulator [Pseudoduganella rivuli]
MAADEVCTTQKAAELLGISVSSVQQLVEAGVIEAWKTKGGHRRIPLAAVHAYKAAPQTGFARAAAPAPTAMPDVHAPVSVLVIEDNAMQRALFERQLAQWDVPIAVRFCENGYQALIEIARSQPDILLADIVMEGIDGYEVIKTILGYPELADMNIAIVSSLEPDALEQRGGVPDGVVFFPKPVNFDEVRGYVRACCAQTMRKRMRHAAQVS